MPSVFTDPSQQYQDNQIFDQIGDGRDQIAGLNQVKNQTQIDNAFQGVAAETLTSKIRLLDKVQL